MKETDTMQSYKYLQAIFGDKWVDWGVSVGFLLLVFLSFFVIALLLIAWRYLR